MDTIVGMRTFAHVVTSGSFTAAAERLGMSTALVSKYVSRLEDRLGVRLLNRTTRSLTLTEMGRVYLDQCQRVLDDFDALEASVQEGHAAPRGTLTIAAPVTFGETYLTPAIADFLHQNPGMSVDLRLTDRFVGLVDDGIDLAIRISDLEDSTLIARRLASAGIVACAAPRYLRDHPKPFKPHDLLDHDCVIDSNFRNGAAWTFMVDGALETIKVTGRFQVNNAAAVRRMVLTGAGIGLIPSHVVGEDLKKGRLVPVLEAFDGYDLGIYAVYAHKNHLAAKVRAFVDFVVERWRGEPEWDRFKA